WDPIKSKFGEGVPALFDFYESLPRMLLLTGHFVIVTGMLAGIAVLAGRDDERELLMPAGVLTAAGLVNVLGIDYLPGLLKIVSLAAAAGMVWYAADRTVPAHDEEQEAEAEVDHHPSHRRDPRAENPQPQPPRRPRPPQPPPTAVPPQPP